MKRYDVHVCLVSDQALPNLLPVLNEATRPHEVVLLTSAAMQDQAELLAAVMRESGCRVVRRDISAWRIEKIRGTIEELLLADYEGRTLALNATGGTKVMALGASEVFRDLDRPVFYVDTQNDAVMFLGQQPVTLSLPDVLRIKTYLRVYGYRIDSQGPLTVAPALRELSAWLIERADPLGRAMASLNWYAAEAKQELNTTLQERHLGFADFRELLARFKAAGLLDYDDRHLVFPDEEARQCVNGGWLEQYLFGVLQGLKKEGRIRDWQGNVQVVSEHGVRNELDGAFTARNRLHLVECKTASLAHNGDRAAGATYKLEALRDLMGGIYGRAMLASYQPLVEADLQRCREYRLRVVQGTQLARLREHLIEWADGR